MLHKCIVLHNIFRVRYSESSSMVTRGVVRSMRNMREPLRSTITRPCWEQEGDKCKDLAPESILELTLDNPLINRQFIIVS